jgi:predicted ester cyclase
MSTESIEKRNKEIIRRYWEEVWADQDRTAFAEVMEPGYAEDEAAFADVIWGAFPDIRCEIVEMIAEGGTVATRLVLSATHTGPAAYDGIAPSGRHVSMEGVVVHHLVDGRIVRDGQLSAWDWLGFYRQLGAIPVQ